MTEDNIESLWRKMMNSSADNCPMEFAKALASRAATTEREACAKVCDNYAELCENEHGHTTLYGDIRADAATGLAKEIRRRSNAKSQATDAASSRPVAPATTG